MTQNAKDRSFKAMGSKGASLPNCMLSYCDHSNLLIVPVAHSLLFGVVATFVSHIFRKLPKPPGGQAYPLDVIPYDARRVINGRASHITCTSDFGRKFKCVSVFKGSYQMEDWLHFVQTFSLYIFLPGTLPEMLATMWKLLLSVFHYCQGTNFTFRKSGDAAKSLLK
eukprot:gene17330-23639_t